MSYLEAQRKSSGAGREIRADEKGAFFPGRGYDPQ